MTNDELQDLIDAVDAAVGYVPPELEKSLKTVSNLLVDLPDEVVEGLLLRSAGVGQDVKSALRDMPPHSSTGARIRR